MNIPLQINIIEKDVTFGIEWIIVKRDQISNYIFHYVCYINYPNPYSSDCQIVNDQWYWTSTRKEYYGWIILEDSTCEFVKHRLQKFLDSVMSSYEVGGQKYTTSENIINTLSK